MWAGSPANQEPCRSQKPQCRQEVFFVGRRPRVEYAEAIYHVIQRGNNREYNF